MNIYGGQMQTYEVSIGTDTLRRYSREPEPGFQALADNNQTRGGAYSTTTISRRSSAAWPRKRPGGHRQHGGGHRSGWRPRHDLHARPGRRAPKVRLGAVTHDGAGETVVGIALMQYGENAEAVVAAVKAAVR